MFVRPRASPPAVLLRPRAPPPAVLSLRIRQDPESGMWEEDQNVGRDRAERECGHLDALPGGGCCRQTEGEARLAAVGNRAGGGSGGREGMPKDSAGLKMVGAPTPAPPFAVVVFWILEGA